MSYVTISVDPEHDTPEILSRYAADYGAEPPRWYFLTGAIHRIKELGEHALRVSIAKEIHTDNIILVDKWGRYRDRFKWDDPYDTQRFTKVAAELAKETAPPLLATVHTRNALAGVVPADWGKVPWIREFHLTQSDERPFFSRDLTGQVWVASFFFTTCTGICVPQNQYLAGLRSRLDADVPLVSITTDPQHDTPERLRDYADGLHAPRENWKFLTGDASLIRRIGSEFFRAQVDGDHHPSRLYVVDKWGRVRGSFDWQQPAAEISLLQLVGELKAETVPRTIVPPPRAQAAEE
jgi:protein SCO1/2